MNEPADLEGFLLSQGFLSVPIERTVAGHFQVEGRVNNHPAVFLVDTGASHSILSDSVAALLGIESQALQERGGGLGTTTAEVRTAVVESLGLGSLTIESLKLLVMDLSHVNDTLRQHGLRTVHGVLGADVFCSRAAVIDYGGSRLFLKLDPE
jgi:clan AA aspartic protease (TIGR02281 family)